VEGRAKTSQQIMVVVGEKIWTGESPPKIQFSVSINGRKFWSGKENPKVRYFKQEEIASL
jgi:hypothetical protein